MRVRDWQDVLRDVVESSADADGWRAVAGDRARGIGEDLYLAHPDAGVYQLKTFAKNPFQVEGVGGRVARRIDDDIGPYLPTEGTGKFGVQSAPEDEDDAREKTRRLEAVVETHADTPTTPADLFDDVMGALDSPAFGPMDHEPNGRTEAIDGLATTLEEADRLLDAEFDDLVEENEVGKAFR